MSPPDLVLYLMEVLDAQTTIDQPVCLMIGNFDGIHRGHQLIFERAHHLAKASGYRTAVLSFEPHPAKVLTPDRAPLLLQTAAQKEALLRHYGIDYFVRLPFNPTFSRLSPRAFLEHIQARIDFSVLLVGFNFRFGWQRAGDGTTLRRLAPGFHFKAVIVPPGLDGNGQVISSSRVRERVLAGDMIAAAKLLGRPYFLEGMVAAGAQLGRRLEAPTANLVVSNELQPRFGVYASWTRVDGQTYRSITNVGRAPTTERGLVRAETHLFDFAEPLYGKHLFVSLGTFIRPEQTFANLDALAHQIQDDIATRQNLEDSHPPDFYLDAR